MTLPSSVYCADRGYAWSNVPPGLSLATLNGFCRSVLTLRGDFPDPMSVEIGLVSDGTTAAVYTLQNVDKWDACGRASDYYAFAFLPVREMARVDFVRLISQDFFWTPSRTPASTIAYEGPAAAVWSGEGTDALRLNGSHVLKEPSALGSLLSTVGGKSDFWSCRLCEGNVFQIQCRPWDAGKEQAK